MIHILSYPSHLNSYSYTICRQFFFHSFKHKFRFFLSWEIIALMFHSCYIINLQSHLNWYHKYTHNIICIHMYVYTHAHNACVKREWWRWWWWKWWWLNMVTCKSKQLKNVVSFIPKLLLSFSRIICVCVFTMCFSWSHHTNTNTITIPRCQLSSSNFHHHLTYTY